MPSGHTYNEEPDDSKWMPKKGWHVALAYIGIPAFACLIGMALSYFLDTPRFYGRAGSVAASEQTEQVPPMP